MSNRKLRTLTEDDILDGIEYDQSGGIKYHPVFHPKHGIPFTDEEMEYLCFFWDYDETRTLAFALGKTEQACRKRVLSLRKRGAFDFYKYQYAKKLQE